MPLEPGLVLGKYEVLAAIGAGAMGEVYRARDTRLGREVALKVLRDEVALDTDRVARFEREAKVLASLNHPHIAHLYGFETADAGGRQIPFLVIELVAGETLADRIARGAIPMSEAIALFIKIAEGLEAAHENGVVHRDLKPANIKVSRTGLVKILDFGLATRLLAGHAEGANASQSPTLTLAATRAGVILGTPAYMSPEQARAEEIDRRTDVWAFGACLYEALTGRPPFAAASVSDILVAILTREPDWKSLPGDTPFDVERLLRRCLTKEPSERLHDIADARIALRDVADEIASGAVTRQSTGRAQATTTAARPSRRLFSHAAGIAAGLVAGVALASIALLAIRREPATAPRPLRRLNLTLPADLPLQVPNPRAPQHAMALSPDGAWLAYVAAGSEGPVLVERRLDSPEFTVVPGSEGAHTVFFSPDSHWIGFCSLTQRKLFKVEVGGGQAQPLCDLHDVTVLGASWGDDGNIYFHDGFAAQGLYGIFRVSDAGGAAELVSELKEEGWRGFPEVLPGATELLFTSRSPGGSMSDASSILGLDLATGKESVIATRSVMATYARSGHLLLPRTGRLTAQAFDAASLRVRGEAVDVSEPGMADAETARRGLAPIVYATSAEGTLIYAPIASSHLSGSVAVVDRSGRSELPPIPDIHPGNAPRVSPDGESLATVQYAAGGLSDIWIHDVARGTSSRLTSSPDHESGPIWSPDGRDVAFVGGGPPYSLRRREATGVGEETVLLEKMEPLRLGCWSAGDSVFFELTSPDSGIDLWTLALDRADSARAILHTRFDETGPALSPDGRWLAYASNENGRNEIYVQRWPELDRRWQVSSEGGAAPRWSASGAEIFFLGAGALWVVDFDGEASAPRIGVARFLFRDRAYDPPEPGFDAFPDGKRFAMVAATGTIGELVVVENWFDELRRKVPPPSD